MAWSQYTFPLGNATQGNDAADLHLGRIDQDTVDEQLHERAALVEDRPLEAGGDPGPDGLYLRDELLDLHFMHRFGVEPLGVALEVGTLLFESAAPRLEFLQRQGLHPYSRQPAAGSASGLGPAGAARRAGGPTARRH